MKNFKEKQSYNLLNTYSKEQALYIRQSLLIIEIIISQLKIIMKDFFCKNNFNIVCLKVFITA